MEKQDYVQYWKTTASGDWKRVNLLLKNRDYVFALFCAHLTLEKLLKAHWVKDNAENFPPKIHNLVALLRQTSLEFSEDETAFLIDMNTFQLEGRYPDYQRKIYKAYRALKTQQIISRCKKIRRFLLKELQ